MRRPDPIGRWVPAGLLALAALLVLQLGAPTSLESSWRSCGVAVEIDGALLCDEEVVTAAASLCSDGSGIDPGILGSGDRIDTVTLCARPSGDRRRSGQGWSRMSPDDLAALEIAVDVNTAEPEELASLPGVGPTLSRRIVQGRPYRRVEDLLEVPGIGEKTLQRIRPRATLGTP